MTKTKEDLEILKIKCAELSTKLNDLSEDELKQVAGGTVLKEYKQVKRGEVYHGIYEHRYIVITRDVDQKNDSMVYFYFAYIDNNDKVVLVSKNECNKTFNVLNKDYRLTYYRYNF